MSEKNKSGVINKAIRIIQAFVDENQEWGVRDLAKFLEMPAPTVHRLLNQLQDEHIILFNKQKNKYVIGSELLRIGAKTSSQLDIKRLTAPYLQNLVDKHLETVCLVLYIKPKKQMIWFDKVNGPEPLQYYISMGELQPLPYGSSGKSIMAFLDEQDIKEICENESFDQEKINTLKDELSKINEERISSTTNERLKGSRGVASPILDADDRPVGSIVFTAPISRVEGKDIETIKNDIKDAAIQISRNLGSNIL